MISFFVALASLVSAQGFCGQDISCLSQQSQYVVLGTVTSNTLNEPESSRTNYSAKINVQCAFLSFSSTGPDRGDNLIGNTIDVSKFGGNNKCPIGYKDATVGSSQIFFIAVRTLRPVSGQTIDYEVVDICVGGIENNSTNLLQLAKVFKSYPENVIPIENRGTDPVCTLPVTNGTTGTNGTNGTTPRVPTNSATSSSLLLGVLILVLQYSL